MSDAFTPVEVAKRHGVQRAKVWAWIKSGDLRAINVAKTSSGAPRYSILREDLERFESIRAFDHGSSVNTD